MDSVPPSPTPCNFDLRWPFKQLAAQLERIGALREKIWRLMVAGDDTQALHDAEVELQALTDERGEFHRDMSLLILMGFRYLALNAEPALDAQLREIAVIAELIASLDAQAATIAKLRADHDAQAATVAKLQAALDKLAASVAKHVAGKPDRSK